MKRISKLTSQIGSSTTNVRTVPIRRASLCVIVALLCVPQAVHAGSVVTNDFSAFTAFLSGATGLINFDDVPGNNESAGALVASANAISNRYQSAGVLFSSTAGPAVAVSAPSDAKSKPNLLGGTSLSGTNPVVNYTQPITINFVNPNTTNTATTDVVGFWNDPTGSRIRLEVFDINGTSLGSVDANQGNFVGFSAPGISKAIVSYLQTQSVTGFSIDDLRFGSAFTFRITDIRTMSNDVLITWNTIPTKTNVVQVTPGWPDGNYTNNFTNLSGNIIVPGFGQVSTNYLDTGGATNRPSRYYRVRLVP
jgi:hypothetical protein